MFTRVKEAWKVLFPKKKATDKVKDLILTEKTMTKRDAADMKKAAIELIKSSNRFMMYSAEKDQDDKPAVLIFNIPQVMLIPILSLMKHSHENLLGQTGSLEQAKKLLNLD